MLKFVKMLFNKAIYLSESRPQTMLLLLMCCFCWCAVVVVVVVAVVSRFKFGK